ncbi:MAG: hypothetical protein JWO95_2659 [Verrucomicrobiales bacterium]|nr:hypothetical protein [Verrucomicrobiales bacterium]
MFVRRRAEFKTDTWRTSSFFCRTCLTGWRQISECPFANAYQVEGSAATPQPPRYWRNANKSSPPGLENDFPTCEMLLKTESTCRGPFAVCHLHCSSRGNEALICFKYAGKIKPNRRTITRAAIHRMRGSLKGKGVLKALMRDRKRDSTEKLPSL